MDNDKFLSTLKYVEISSNYGDLIFCGDSVYLQQEEKEYYLETEDEAIKYLTKIVQGKFKVDFTFKGAFFAGSVKDFKEFLFIFNHLQFKLDDVIVESGNWENYDFSSSLDFIFVAQC